MSPKRNLKRPLARAVRHFERWEHKNTYVQKSFMDSNKVGMTTSLKSQPTTSTSSTSDNASQLNDGAATLVMVDSKLAEKQYLETLCACKDFVVVKCKPDEMGIRLVFTVPRLLKRQRLALEGIDL